MEENRNNCIQFMLNEKLCMSLSYCKDLMMENELVTMLSSSELERYRKFKNEYARRNFLAGRTAAKMAIKSLFEEKQVSDISITNGLFHEPILDFCDVSISHVDVFGAAIASKTKDYLGIDIELNDARHNRSIESIMTESEKEILCKRNLQIMGWTVKEAISKVFHTGMATDYKVYEINSVNEEKGIYISTFSNFGQYKALSILVDKLWITLVVPKMYEIKLDLKQISYLVERGFE